MSKALLVFFLTAHLLADFYAQTHAMAEGKKARLRTLLLHGAVYAVIFTGLSAAVFTTPVIWTALVLSALHLAVDLIKYGVLKKHASSADSKNDAQADPEADMADSPQAAPAKRPMDPASFEAAVYCADQCLHLLLIAAAVLLLPSIAGPPAVWPWCDAVAAALPAAPYLLLKGLLLLLFIGKPANITIKQLTARYKPQKPSDDPSRDNAGAFIGFVERATMILLMAVGQYTAIGLVLTAKSVARYKKISEDQSFAEYYLLGTLLSTLLAVGAYVGLFGAM